MRKHKKNKTMRYSHRKHTLPIYTLPRVSKNNMLKKCCIFPSHSSPLSVVCDHVPAQVAGVVEAGGTLIAGVWLLSRVSPQVDLQAAVLREAFPTLSTCVRLLPCVNAHVYGQSGLVDKRLAAKGAGNRRLPGVSCPVYNQVFTTVEALATEAAVQGFVREDVLLLGELAHITGVHQMTICSYYCLFHCRI